MSKQTRYHLNALFLLVLLGAATAPSFVMLRCTNLRVGLQQGRATRPKARNAALRV